MDVEDFLLKHNELLRSGRTKAAQRLVVEYVDDTLQRQNFRAVDGMLESLSLGGWALPHEFLEAILKVVEPHRHKLNSFNNFNSLDAFKKHLEKGDDY